MITYPQGRVGSKDCKSLLQVIKAYHGKGLQAYCGRAVDHHGPRTVDEDNQFSTFLNDAEA
jgi:hypothetical protein